MRTTALSQRLRGRAIGSLFFSTFGALWLTLAFSATHRLGFSLAAALLAYWLALVGASLLIIKRVGPIALSPAEALLDKKRQRAFNIVNITQWIAIVIAILVLPQFHLETFVPSAIVAIVGLHLFPLARVFCYRPHYLTGAALLLWAATILARPLGVIEFETGLGAGLILWISATATLAVTLKELSEDFPLLAQRT